MKSMAIIYEQNITINNTDNNLFNTTREHKDLNQTQFH